jgi:hypothetical protein
MEEMRMRRVFIKPANGSSASGVAALETNGRAFQATTSVEPEGTRLYNSLKLKRYRKIDEIRSIVDALGAESIHVEQWIPKAQWQSCSIDLRILAILGKALHSVVRMSKSPMTNLHLGNRRGETKDLVKIIGRDFWERGKEICRQTAKAFPGCIQVGVDLMPAARFRKWVVAEANAFGDLLPGICVDGLSTYEYQAREILYSQRRRAS